MGANRTAAEPLQLFVVDRPPTTSVLVIEDQQVLSGALRAALEPVTDLTVIGTAPSLAEGVAAAERLEPDIVISDYRLGDGDVVDRLADLQAAAPATRVLVFTGWADEASLVRAMAAGASGFIEKTSSFDDLLHAIRRVAAGEVVVSPRLLPVLARRATGDTTESLSQRELEVLELLSTGHTTSEIAAELHLAVNTVRNHLARLFEKLGVHSRLEAVRAGVERGLIRFDPPAP